MGNGKYILRAAMLGLFSMYLPVAADIRLPAIFGDNMVLQHSSRVAIWGEADVNEKIKINCSWCSQGWKTTAGAKGRFKVVIDSPKAGGPYWMTLSGNNTVEINNMLAGEVWLCSGQSNMAVPVKGAAGAESELGNADHPGIRLFTVGYNPATRPRTDCSGNWAVCSPETAWNFSAVGYYFGKKLHSDLNVPIGLISSSRGSTAIEFWMDAEGLDKFEEFHPALEELEKDSLRIEQRWSRYEEEERQWFDNLNKLDANQRWMEPDLDDSAWRTTKVPSCYRQMGMGDFDGAIWFRREISLPEEWMGKAATLELGRIDDMDITWVNGVRVGSQERPEYQTPRRYDVPENVLKTGSNSIVVRVMDTGGWGGFGDADNRCRLVPADAGQEPLGLAGDWHYNVGLDIRNQTPRPIRPPLLSTSLYNGMIAPLLPFVIKGVIWYQGESNALRAWQYRYLFPNLIRAWRKAWGQGDFPFYFVQIAPFGYREAFIGPELREAQAMALSLPGTGMAVTMDIGSPANIHPKNKQEVGRRLALWALAGEYGRRDLVCSGPLYKSMEIEGDRIRLSFDFIGGGLFVKGGPLTYFHAAGSDKVFHAAVADLDGDTIVVHSEKVKAPVAVRYGWSNDAEPNLFNREGLPASSFRTDDWQGVTYGRKIP